MHVSEFEDKVKHMTFWTYACLGGMSATGDGISCTTGFMGLIWCRPRMAMVFVFVAGVRFDCACSSDEQRASSLLFHVWIQCA